MDNCDQYGPTDSRIWNVKDTDGHGSHVAATVAGNFLFNLGIVDADGNINNDFPIPQLSGVAPHANIIAYKVCAPSCFFTDIAAATEQAAEAVADGGTDVEAAAEAVAVEGAAEAAVAEELLKFDGVAAAVSSTALRNASLPDTLLMRAILRNFHPKRSGDIYLVFEPNVFINDFDGLTVSSTHGSPWRYDTYVPVIFAGNGLQATRVERAVTPYDIAPTLSAYLGVKPPSGAVGAVLPEVLNQ